MASQWASVKVGGFDLSKSSCLSQKAAQMWVFPFRAECGMFKAMFKANKRVNELNTGLGSRLS